MRFVAGRVQVLLLLKCFGVGCLYWMALMPSIWQQPLLILAVSLARMAFMNSGYPIQKSILMDYVPRVSKVTPSMSAMLGIPTTCSTCPSPRWSFEIAAVLYAVQTLQLRAGECEAFL